MSAPGAHYRRITAKRTRVGKDLMRSRLEARAARILKAYKIPYAYEPETFSDRFRAGTGYLPDFRLWPRRRAAPWYLEVKPAGLSDRAPVAEFHAALDKMNVIRISEPDAVFVLWLVDSTAGRLGALLINLPGGKWISKPGTYLGELARDRRPRRRLVPTLGRRS